MNLQQLIMEIHHLSPEQIEALRWEIDRLCAESAPVSTQPDAAFQQFLTTVERYQTRYPGEFHFDREEANER